jgi:hypothetical protein
MQWFTKPWPADDVRCGKIPARKTDEPFMLQRLRPTTRLSLAMVLLGWLLLQVTLPVFSHVPALPEFGRTLLLLVAAAIPVFTWLLLSLFPDADVPPESLEFLILVASLGIAATLVLRWARTPHSGIALAQGGQLQQ